MFIGYLLITLSIAGIIYFALYKADKKMYGVIAAVITLVISISVYKLFLEQIIAKSYGGSMTITVPEDTRFYGITWKDDDLWIGWYDDALKECIFKEDSKYNILQGKITVKNCHPIALTK